MSDNKNGRFGLYGKVQQFEELGFKVLSGFTTGWRTAVGALQCSNRSQDENFIKLEGPR